MNTTLKQPVSLKVSRLIKAPRERVFAAWTTPADIQKWLGGPGCQVQSVKVDLRVGGAYEIVTQKGTGCSMGVVGEYREINPPSRLVFAWRFIQTGPDDDGLDSQVTVDLTEEKGGTLVTITHEGFPTTELRDAHNEGWTASLEKLEKLV